MAKYISISLIIMMGCLILLWPLLYVFEDVMISISVVFLLLLTIIIAFLIKIIE